MVVIIIMLLSTEIDVIKIPVRVNERHKITTCDCVYFFQKRENEYK